MLAAGKLQRVLRTRWLACMVLESTLSYPAGGQRRVLRFGVRNEFGMWNLDPDSGSSQGRRVYMHISCVLSAVVIYRRGTAQPCHP
jgi:hypothetical protein